MALVMCSLSPGCAVEKSMPDGSVGDRSNGSVLFPGSPGGKLCSGGTQDYHFQWLIITCVERSQYAEVCFTCIASSKHHSNLARYALLLRHIYYTCHRYG